MTPRRARALAAALVFVLAAAALGAESDSRAGPRAPGQKECPRGQVTVVFAGQKSCRPLAAVIPKPRKGDLRATIFRQLLTSDWGSPPDLKNRRPPTLRELLEPFGPAAYAAATEGVAGIPKTIDRLRPKPRALASLGSSWLAAKAPCRPPGPKLTDSKRKDLGNGAAFELRLELGNRASAGFAVEGKAKDGSNRTVRWDVDFDLCDSNISLSIQDCPTADGAIDGSGSTKFTLTVTTLKDGAVEHSEKIELAYKVKLRGKVAVDAKLDTVDVDYSYSVKRSSSRQSVLWGPASEQGRVERTTRVNMRTGAYDPGRANVLDVQFTYSGVLSVFVQDRLAQARIASELARQSNEEFAQTVAKVIQEYRQRESAWQTPNTCATLEFAPPSRTLRLRDGQTGTIKGTVKAKRGGVASDGRWRRGGQRNVNVTPSQASGAQPTFSYRVGDAERGVSASFRATSPAGVAAGDWEQGGEGLPARFEGTFSGVIRAAGETSFSGRILFVRSGLQGGLVTYRAERVSFRVTDRVDRPPCRGSGSADVPAFRPDPRISVLSIAKEVVTARGHFYAIAAAFTSPTPTTMSVVCGGTPSTIPWAPAAALQTAGQPYYTEGRLIAGRYVAPAGGMSSYMWNLKGSG